MLIWFGMERKMKTNILLLTGCLITVLLAGCGGKEKPVPISQICTETVNVDSAMLAAEDVLLRMQFEISKADAESGYILTKPLRGGQFFEFWRKDNIGSANKLQSNLHTIRRTAQIRILEKQGSVCFTCDVQKYRLSIPEHQVSSTSQAYAMHSKSKQSRQSLKLYPEQEQKMAWIDLGSDEKLAGEILKRIQKKTIEMTKEATQ